MDELIESATRKSETEIRGKMLDYLLNEPYEKKVNKSNAIVNEFVDILGIDKVYVSTSGGKDSACVSKICKRLYPQIQHIMFNTGLEYQATIELAKKQGAKIIPPQTSWIRFCEEKGYPVGSKKTSKRLHDVKSGAKSCAISFFSRQYGLADKWLHFLSSEFVDFPISNKCCDEFKKKPAKRTKLNPIVGTRVQESDQRRTAWKKSGCNSFDLKYKQGESRPISLWTDNDVNTYVDNENVELSEIYTQYQQKRTGCVNCPYGAHCNDDNRFDLLKRLEPGRYKYFMGTKLRKILALSDVEICSDLEYMMYKNQIQGDVKMWHKKVKSNDKYLSWKVCYALNIYHPDELKDAVVHISQYPMKYSSQKIIKEIDRQLEER